MILTGLVIMPHEKLHVLFGLILMTQYFTSVTTSVSLLSQAEEAGAKASLSSSLSDSSPPSKSLLLSASSSHHPSSTHLFWPVASTAIRKHRAKGFYSQIVPYSFHHSSPHSGSDLRLSSMLENTRKEDPIIKVYTSSKHQKRHIKSGNDSIATGSRNHGSSGGSGDNHSNQGHKVKQEASNELNAVAVTTYHQSHLLFTATSPSTPLSFDTVLQGGNSGRQLQGSNPFVRNYRQRDYKGQCRHHTAIPHYKSIYYPPELYLLDTCAWCYFYMRPEMFGKPSRKILNTTFTRHGFNPVDNLPYRILGFIVDNETIMANISDTESPILQSFPTEEAKKDWIACCQAAEECCERMVAAPKNSYKPELDAEIDEQDDDGNDSECPPTWDGWQCWNSTKSGVFAESYCPHYIYFLTDPPACSIPVEKECTVNGTWARKGHKEWTNYKVCVQSTVSIQRSRSYVLVTAYAISIFVLVPAVIIFFSFKQLRVHRIILHQNLFFSLILNALLVILFQTAVMMSERNSISDGSAGHSIIKGNSIGCRLLLISTKYSRMTNYMWMLCEGFYLHKLIAAAFAEQKSLLVFYLIGWVFPLFPTAFYAGFRMLKANDECWVLPQENWEWALNGPSLLSLLVNAFFLIDIIRVLVTKLRAAHAQEPSQYRKAVRATLVLLPLFGLHFIVTIYRPSSSTGVCQNWTELYFYANDILDGMHGFFVALIFCYCNGEVISLLKRAYTRWKEQHFDMGNRRNSRHRPSRGSVLGRSVVSTHIYSSIPPSPETNVIALPCGSSSMDPSPTSQQPVTTNLLAVNGSSGTVTVSANVINNGSSPNLKKSDSKSCLKNRKNHTSTTTNGNAINMYVSSEYGSVTENPGVEISCV